MDPILSKMGNLALFYVQRSMDDEIVMYRAKREGNVLNPPYVDLFWTNVEALHTQQEVGAKAQEMFFGCKVRKQGIGKYDMLVNAMPDKLLTIHLRKSGKCVVKTVINNKESHLQKIYVEMTTTSLGLPTVKHLLVYGKHKDIIECETIHVTEEMRQRFDVTNFLPSFTSLLTGGN